jgi:hypothetical protein
VEKELRAQIERAVHSGLRIDYVDYHMGTAVDKPELRALLERLAKEYGLAISRYFGEEDVNGVYSAPPPTKLDTLLDRTRKLPAGKINLMVFHVGLQGPEMDAMIDLNVFGPPDMSKHRQGELDALTSAAFQKALRQRNVYLTSYHELMERVGIKGMKRPVGQD